jgi:hypothetical protein
LQCKISNHVELRIPEQLVSPPLSFAIDCSASSVLGQYCLSHARVGNAIRTRV